MLSFNQQPVFSSRKEASAEAIKIRVKCTKHEWTRVKKRIKWMKSYILKIDMSQNLFSSVKKLEGYVELQWEI